MLKYSKGHCPCLLRVRFDKAVMGGNTPNTDLGSPIHAISLIPEAGQREDQADSKQTAS